MDPSDVAFIKGVIAFAMFAGTGLSAFWLYVRARQANRPEMDKVLESFNEENTALQTEMRSRILELEERLDFVERRMVQPSQAPPLRQGRIPTPV